MDVLNTLRFGWRRRLPMMLQTQAAECGLACVGMIANYLGHDVDMVSLRRRFNTSLKGATLADLMSIANRLGMASRALRLEMDSLDKLKLPCILHWEFSHFVVLKSVGKRGIVIHDPARGIREIAFEDVSKSFTGVALELTPSPSFKPIVEKESVSLWNLLVNVQGIKTAFVQVMILSIALEVFGIVSPFYMQWVMDQVLVSADSDLLTLLGCGFLMVVVFQNAITALRTWLITWLSSIVNVQWTANVMSHLLGLPMAWFEQRHVGDVVSRFGSIGSIQSTLTSRSITTILDGVMTIATLVMMFVYDATLSWLVLGLFAVYALIRWVAYRPFRRANEDQIAYTARGQSQLLESIRGVQAIKLANKQEMRVASFANATVDIANQGVAVQRLSIGFSTLQSLIGGSGRVVLVWLAARQVLQGGFSAGMLMAFVSFSDQFTSRASGLINTFIDFRMLRLHGERLGDIVLTDVEEHREPTVDVPRVAEVLPRIDVQGLRFRYGETEPWVLDDCVFTIQPGESVALIGPSGGGKTTVAKLLLGLLTPAEGSVLVDGVDIRQLGLDRYRDMVGCVMQDDILFAGSIADNISFFDQDVNQALVEQVAKLAHVHDDIAAMPMGYHTLVGDMGSSLSGGQRQRVLLARALYRRPSILVLDEATSHLDVDRERKINEEIRALRVTKIIIAHRPETIRAADRVILLAKGKAHEVRLDAQAVQAAPPATAPEASAPSQATSQPAT